MMSGCGLKSPPTLSYSHTPLSSCIPSERCPGQSGIKAVAHTDPPASSAPGAWGLCQGGVREELPQRVSQTPRANSHNSPGQITGLQSAPAKWGDRAA